MTPFPVPSLDELAADPSKAASLSADAARSITVRCAAVLAAVATASAAPVSQSNDAHGDRLLTTEEAAQRLGVSEDWLYRRSARLPFTVRLGRSLRFSAYGLARYIRTRQGR